jgi:hypothetical protein
MAAGSHHKISLFELKAVRITERVKQLRYFIAQEYG